MEQVLVTSVSGLVMAMMLMWFWEGRKWSFLHKTLFFIVTAMLFVSIKELTIDIFT